MPIIDAAQTWLRLRLWRCLRTPALPMRALVCVLYSIVCSAQQYVVSTLAGGAPPPTPAAAASASIALPCGIAVDSAGNVFFNSVECVFALSPSGILTRIAGNARPGFTGDGGPAINAQVGVGGIGAQPGAIAVDQAGNLYIAESENSRVR